MAKDQYKTADLTTLEGQRQAEALKLKGWRVIHNTMFSIMFEKPEAVKANNCVRKFRQEQDSMTLEAQIRAIECRMVKGQANKFAASNKVKALNKQLQERKEFEYLAQ